MGHAYGWKPSKPDSRDHLWHETDAGKKALAKRLPPKVSLRDQCPPVWDQGQLGSCVPHGTLAALVFEQMKQGQPYKIPSRLFAYYEGRRIEGTVSYDSGLEVRDGIKVLANTGAPPETDWAYKISLFTQKPPAVAYNDAPVHKALAFSKLIADGHLRACLASGSPYVFGFSVYESFESQEVEDTGIVPYPDPSEAVIGGHCMLAVGYDNSRKLIECRNSWGPDFGDHGYVWMPYAYFTTPESQSLATDAWNITVAT